VDQFQSFTMFPDGNHLLRTVQAVFRRSPLSKVPASFRQASRQRSMSASEVDQPRLSRTAPLANSPRNPIASSTCDGRTLPEEQAEPEDTAIPARSKPITAVSALSPGTVKSDVFGSRATPSENTMAPGVCRRPVSSRFRRVSCRTASLSNVLMAAFTAAPKPAIPATFSVPARCPNSWPPPRSSAGNPCTCSPKIKAPTPLGPPILCPEIVRTSAFKALRLKTILPNA